MNHNLEADQEGQICLNCYSTPIQVQLLLTCDEFPSMYFFKMQSKTEIRSFKRKWWRDTVDDSASRSADWTWDRQRGCISVKLTTLVGLGEDWELGCKYMRVTQVTVILRGLTGEGYSSSAKALLHDAERNSPSFSTHSSFTCSFHTSSAPGHDFMHIIKTKGAGNCLSRFVKT